MLCLATCEVVNKSRSWSLNNIGVSTANLMLSTKSQLPLRSLFCVSHIYICIFDISLMMVWEKKPAFLLLQVLQSQKNNFSSVLFFLHLSPSTVVDIGWGLAVNQRRKPGCTFWSTNIGVLCTFWSVNFGVLWYFAPFGVLYSFICCHLTFYCRTREVEAFSFGRRIFWIFDKWPMAG